MTSIFSLDHLTGRAIVSVTFFVMNKLRKKRGSGFRQVITEPAARAKSMNDLKLKELTTERDLGTPGLIMNGPSLNHS